MKKLTILLVLSFLLSAILFATSDVEVNLDGITTSHAFTVKNNQATPDTLLKVGGDGNVRVKTGSYLNYGSAAAAEGSAGYGFRDNGGILEYKNSAGSWTPWVVAPTTPYGFGTDKYSYGQIAYYHGSYGANQTLVPVGVTGTGVYGSMFPCDIVSGTPYESSSNGDVSILNIDRGAGDGSLPAYIKIGVAGTYRVTVTTAIQGTNNESIEVEVFKQNSTGIPVITSWTSPTHDIEALSTVVSATNNQYSAGTITGIISFSANDVLAVCARVVDNSPSSQKVVCINFNVQRIN